MLLPVDIILPCYNPHNNWYRGLLDFYEQVKGTYAVNFILVNDGSVSGMIAEQINMLKQRGIPLTYISYGKNMGKGHALRQGVSASANKFAVYTDVDFPFTNQSILSVIHTLASEPCDVVAGYRSENYYRNTMSAYRKLLSRLFRFFLRRVLNMPVSDTQCGLKGFNARGKAKFLKTGIKRYLFDFEFIHAVVHDQTLVIKTVQVELKENVVFSKMKLKVIVQETLNLLYILLFRKN